MTRISLPGLALLLLCVSPLSVDYYDEEMTLTRSMAYTDPRDFGGRILPARLVMKPADKPGERTEVVYHELRFDVELPGDFFTLRNLKQ